jgi:hypothetical protein
MIVLIRQFGQLLKQLFGWLVDVFVTACVWGISQVVHLFNTHITIASSNIVALLIVLILFVLFGWLVYWLFFNIWYRIELALRMVGNAIGILLMALVVVTTGFAGVGVVCFLASWLIGHIASLRF